MQTRIDVKVCRAWPLETTNHRSGLAILPHEQKKLLRKFTRLRSRLSTQELLSQRQTMPRNLSPCQRIETLLQRVKYRGGILNFGKRGTKRGNVRIAINFVSKTEIHRSM